MKKLLLLIVSLLMVGLCACENIEFAGEGEKDSFAQNSNPSTNYEIPKKPFDGLNVSENAQKAYNMSFKDDYTPEEYSILIDLLKESTKEESLEPVYMINKNLLFVQRIIDTYDKHEESVAVIDTNGKIIQNWNADWGVYDIQYRAKCGEYFFIIKKGYIYNTYDCDVVNQEGEIISEVHCKGERYDIGSGYVFFSLGGDFGNIMTPTGEVIELNYKSVYPSYCDHSGSLVEGKDEIGKVSEGLFYGFSKGNNNTVAYYYNTQGEVVIDLSTQAVNFEVTKLSDFSNGQATIEFIGANGKDYTAIIDKTGNFVGEPMEK